MLPIFMKKAEKDKASCCPDAQFQGEEKTSIPNIAESSPEPEHIKELTDSSIQASENGEGLENPEVDLSNAMQQISSLSDEQTAIGGIMELTHANEENVSYENLAYKSVVTNAGAFTACRWVAKYTEDSEDGLGMPQLTEALNNLCGLMLVHNTGKGGERAKQAFAAMKEELQKEFTLQKEAKGLMQH